MTYKFHPEAELELNHAINYYEECQPRLGIEFADEVFQTIHRILDFPKAWHKLCMQTLDAVLPSVFLLALFIIKKMSRLLF